jgi:hypothetical protein
VFFAGFGHDFRRKVGQKQEAKVKLHIDRAKIPFIGANLIGLQGLKRPILRRIEKFYE